MSNIHVSTISNRSDGNQNMGTSNTPPSSAIIDVEVTEEQGKWASRIEHKGGPRSVGYRSFNHRPGRTAIKSCWACISFGRAFHHATGRAEKALAESKQAFLGSGITQRFWSTEHKALLGEHTRRDDYLDMLASQCRAEVKTNTLNLIWYVTWSLWSWWCTGWMSQ